MSFSMHFMAYFVALVLVGLAFGEAVEDAIKQLSGLNESLSFKHFSGYLNVSENHRLHYWFIESERDPQKDPLVFWFNGGPGCSSIGAGLLKELGPYLVDAQGKALVPNPDAWTKFASVVFIESPAGVGFSYSTDGNVTTDDDLTAKENYEAVKQFLIKFPAFRNHSVFITGESYAGVYVPMLTTQILEGQKDFPINLKGIAIGNGVLDEDINVDTMIRFAYSHGIIGETYFHKLVDTCCTDACADNCQLSFSDQHNLPCIHFVLHTYNFLWTTGLNTYDIFRRCHGNSKLNSLRFRSIQQSVLADESILRPHNLTVASILSDFPTFLPHDHQPKKEKLAQKELKEGAAQNIQSDEGAEEEEEENDIPCLDDRDVTGYLNNAEVRKALNIPEHLPKWHICTDQYFYTKTRKNMRPYIEKILDANVRVLLFYGDTDMACNFLMGEQFSANLGIKEIDRQKAWRFHKQIAGYKTTYERGLTFITVLGAGHMAPAWRAPETSYAIQKFIDDQPI